MSPYFKFKHGSALSKEGDKNQFACRPYKGVQRELGPADSGSLGTTNSSGFPITPCKSASSNISSPTITAVTSTAGIGINRDTGNVRETSHKGGSTRPKGFCFSDISGAQEGWRLQTGNKPEGSEQIYCGGALQDGGFPHGEGFNKTRGLVGQNRPEGCLLLGTSSPQSPEIPSISMAGHTVRVSVSAFRPILCPSHLHKTDETGGSPSEGEGNQTHCIPGRHIDHVQLSGHPDQPVEICQGPVSGAGPSHQREKISARSLPRNCAPGPGYFNYYNASVTSQREGGPDSAGGQAITGHVRSISPEVSNVGGQDNSCKAGNSSGSTVPSPPSSSDKQSGSISILHRGGETVLPPHGGIICGSQTGAGMVDARNARPQWGSIDDGYSRHGDRIICFLPWLGCNLEGPRVKDGRTVVNQRTRDAHQLPGITGGITGNSDFCQREEEHQDISEDRQCIDQSIHKSLWGDSLMADESLSHTDMEVVHRAPDIFDGRASPRGVESGSGRGVKNHQGPLQLDAPPTFVLTDQGKDGSPRSGHVCISSHTPTPTVLQLEAGPSSGSNRCVCSRLESFSGVCEPSVVPPPTYTYKDSTGESQSGPGGSNMEDTTMVPSPSTTTMRISTSDSTATGCCDLTNSGGIHHAAGGTTISRLAIIRDQSRSGGLSEGASRLLESSWRSKTKSTYESLFKRWNNWCQERSRDPIRGPVTDILNFLAELFEQGFQYRSLNAYRSAISSVHEKIDGIEVGKHPLVSRMLKGVFNERPPRPKYESVWKVDQVLTMFRKMVAQLPFLCRI